MWSDVLRYERGPPRAATWAEISTPLAGVADAIAAGLGTLKRARDSPDAISPRDTALRTTFEKAGSRR